MKHVMTLAFVLAAASCGGKSKPSASVGGTGPAASSPIPLGIHGCHFIVEGDQFNHHRCDVLEGGRLDKLSGMETFTGTFAPMGTGVHLTAESNGQPFEVHLQKEGATWKGQVQAKSGGQAEGEWWLASSTFELDDAAGYGGAEYGGAAE